MNVHKGSMNVHEGKISLKKFPRRRTFGKNSALQKFDVMNEQDSKIKFFDREFKLNKIPFKIFIQY
jgi:hypothetical protein